MYILPSNLVAQEEMASLLDFNPNYVVYRHYMASSAQRPPSKGIMNSQS